MLTPETMRFFMRPPAISFASWASLRKQATLTVLSTVAVSSCTRSIRRSCSAARTRQEAMIENSTPITSASTRIPRLVRATTLRGSSRANFRRVSRLELKDHLDAGADRGTVDVGDGVRAALHQLERRLGIGYLERRGGLAREHEACPIGAHFR